MTIDTPFRKGLVALRLRRGKSVERGSVNSACGQLGAFVRQVQAQEGRQVSESDAAILREDAEEVLALLGC